MPAVNQQGIAALIIDRQNRWLQSIGVLKLSGNYYESPVDRDDFISGAKLVLDLAPNAGLLSWTDSPTNMAYVLVYDKTRTTAEAIRSQARTKEYQIIEEFNPRDLRVLEAESVAQAILLGFLRPEEIDEPSGLLPFLESELANLDADIQYPDWKPPNRIVE